MRPFALALLSLAATALFASEPWLHPEERVDITLMRHVDVTGDGHNDEVRLHLQADTFKSPFHWNLRIISRGVEIYSHDSDDTWLNGFFGDSGYVANGCTDYIDCKRVYYFERILGRLVSRAPQDVKNATWDRANEGSIYAVATRDLVEHSGQSRADANRIVDGLAAKLRKGSLPVVTVPVSAVQDNFPIAWCEAVKRFVRVYEW